MKRLSNKVEWTEKEDRLYEEEAPLFRFSIILLLKLEQRKWSVEKLAAKAGMPVSIVKQILGLKKAPNMRDIVKLARALGYRFVWYVEERHEQ